MKSMTNTYTQYYSSVSDILDDTGIIPADIGFSDTGDITADQQLESKIESWLVEAKSMIDANRDQDYSLLLQNGKITAIPICIHNIAKRITINMANSAKLNRKSPVLKVNDYSVKTVNQDPITPQILADLEQCSPKVLDDPDNIPCCAVSISRL